MVRLFRKGNHKTTGSKFCTYNGNKNKVELNSRITQYLSKKYPTQYGQCYQYSSRTHMVLMKYFKFLLLFLEEFSSSTFRFLWASTLRKSDVSLRGWFFTILYSTIVSSFSLWNKECIYHVCTYKLFTSTYRLLIDEFFYLLRRFIWNYQVYT